MKIMDTKTVQLIKEDIKRFPVTMYIILTMTLLWPLFIAVIGDTNLIIIGIGLLIAFATYIPEVIMEERKLKYYILSIILIIFGRVIYLIFGLIFILIFKYRKSEKSLWNYTKSVIKILLYLLMASFIEASIVMVAMFGAEVVSTTASSEILTIVSLFIVLELGVLLFGLVFIPKILYKISEL